MLPCVYGYAINRWKTSQKNKKLDTNGQVEKNSPLLLQNLCWNVFIFAQKKLLPDSFQIYGMYEEMMILTFRDPLLLQ